MKQKVSISIEEETIRKIKEKLVEGTFRNKSHLVEFAVIKLLKEENDRD